MSPPRSSVNFTDLRIKLFGPTLDDLVLCGVDRLMDLFTHPCQEDGTLDSESEESFYKSCETLPPETRMPTHAVSKFTVAKLSRKEMEYISGAIAQQLRHKDRGRFAGTESGDDNSNPVLRRSRWAITRINEFDDGAKTYEIIKSLDEQLLPGQAVPQGTEIVFGVLKHGHTISYKPSTSTHHRCR